MSNLLINPSLASSSLDHPSMAPNSDTGLDPTIPLPTVSDSSSGSPSLTSQPPTDISEPSDQPSVTSRSSFHPSTPSDLKARQTLPDVHISNMPTLSSPSPSPTSHKLTYYMDHQLLDPNSDLSRTHVGSSTKLNFDPYTGLPQWFLTSYLDRLYAPYLYYDHSLNESLVSTHLTHIKENFQRRLDNGHPNPVTSLFSFSLQDSSFSDHLTDTELDDLLRHFVQQPCHSTFDIQPGTFVVRDYRQHFTSFSSSSSSCTRSSHSRSTGGSYSRPSPSTVYSPSLQPEDVSVSTDTTTSTIQTSSVTTFFPGSTHPSSTPLSRPTPSFITSSTVTTPTRSVKSSSLSSSFETTKSPKDVPLSPSVATDPTSNATTADQPSTLDPDPSPSITQFRGRKIKPIRPKAPSTNPYHVESPTILRRSDTHTNMSSDPIQPSLSDQPSVTATPSSTPVVAASDPPPDPAWDNPTRDGFTYAPSADNVQASRSSPSDPHPYFDPLSASSISPDSLPYSSNWISRKIDIPQPLASNPRLLSTGPWRSFHDDHGAIVVYPLPVHHAPYDPQLYMAKLNQTLYKPEALKTFYQQIPSLPAAHSDPLSTILPWMMLVSSVCVTYGVYAPPLYTLNRTFPLGLLYPNPHVTDPTLKMAPHVKANIDNNAFDPILIRLITNILYKDTRFKNIHLYVPPSSSGYVMWLNLAIYAGHPALRAHPFDPHPPLQSNHMKLHAYIHAWQDYLYKIRLINIHYSDRGFFYSFHRNLHPQFHKNIGMHLMASLEILPWSRPLPPSWSVDNLSTKLQALATQYGIRNCFYTTPKDLYQSSTSANVRQVIENPLPTPSLPPDPSDPVLHQLTTPRPPPSCHFCGKPDCTATKCPIAAKIENIIQKDSRAKKTIARRLKFDVRALAQDSDIPDTSLPLDLSSPLLDTSAPLNNPNIPNPDNLSSDPQSQVHEPLISFEDPPTTPDFPFAG